MDVRTLCLGILTFGDRTGYEIKKMFEEGPFSHFFGASYGSIYPAMGRLMEEGLVTCTEIPQERRPNKKIYAVTSEGREEFADAMTRLSMMPAPEDKFRSDFLVSIMFAEDFSPRQLTRLLDERMEHHRSLLERIEETKADYPTAGGTFVAAYGLAIHRAAMAFLEENRKNLEEVASEHQIESQKSAAE